MLARQSRCTNLLVNINASMHSHKKNTEYFGIEKTRKLTFPLDLQREEPDQKPVFHLFCMMMFFQTLMPSFNTYINSASKLG